MDLKQIRAGIRGGRLVALMATVLAVGVLWGTVVVQDRAPEPVPLSGSAVASVPLAHLPPQGQDVMARIQEGGPFRYEKDGTVFGNRERLLPGNKRGYYREYTVPTPGLGHRGARRIVCGGEAPRNPDACYFTEDHYSSFRLIVQ